MGWSQTACSCSTSSSLRPPASASPAARALARLGRSQGRGCCISQPLPSTAAGEARTAPRGNTGHQRTKSCPGHWSRGSWESRRRWEQDPGAWLSCLQPGPRKQGQMKETGRTASQTAQEFLPVPPPPSFPRWGSSARACGRGGGAHRLTVLQDAGLPTPGPDHLTVLVDLPDLLDLLVEEAIILHLGRLVRVDPLGDELLAKLCLQLGILLGGSALRISAPEGERDKGSQGFACNGQRNKSARRKERQIRTSRETRTPWMANGTRVAEAAGGSGARATGRCPWRPRATRVQWGSRSLRVKHHELSGGGGKPGWPGSFPWG